MKSELLNFIFKKNKCNHKNALLNSNEGYCPDCGKYLKKTYYLVRCSCCDIKREAKIYWGEILPANKYCPNCGNREYYIEKLETINLVDANFAVYLKEEAIQEKCISPEIQIWVEDEKQKQITAKN